MTAKGPLVLHIPAGVGIDQSVRPEHVQPGTANLYAENVRVTNQGSFVKRPGFTALSRSCIGPGSPADISTGLRVAAHKGNIVVSDGKILYSYIPTQAKWAPRGRLPECSATTTATCSTGALSGGLVTRIAYSNNFYAIASIEPTGASVASYDVVVRLVDQATKKVVLSFTATDTPSTTLIDLRIAIVSGYLSLIWGDGIHIYGRVINLASPTTIGNRVTIASDFNETWMDVTALSDRVALAYENSGGGTTRISLLTLNNTTLATLSSTTQTTSSDPIASLSISGLEELWVAWSYSTADKKLWVSMRVTSSLAAIGSASAVIDFASASGFATVGTVIGRTGTSEVYVAAVGEDGTAFIKYSRIIQLTNMASTITAGRAMTYLGGWLPAAKPFAVSGRVYMELAFSQPTVVADIVLADITSDASTTTFDRNQTVRPVAWVAPRANAASGGTVAAVSSTLYASAHLIQVSATTASINVSEYDFASNTRQLSLAMAGLLYFAGGLLYSFDGERCFESEFIAPPVIQASAGAGTGITGTFIYTAIHEYADAAGNVIWSQPALTRTVTLSNQKANVYIQRPSVTWMEGYDSSTYLLPQGGRRTKTKVYRTTDGGGLFYLLTTIQNNPLDGLQTYVDSTTDATLQGNARLYTDPGTVGRAKDRQGFGACSQLVECNGVLVAAMEDGTTLRAFAQRTVGEAPWHNDVLQMPIEGDGLITGLASMDGSVVVFKRDCIFVVPVDPANDNVTTGGFGDPRRIAIDAGCIEPRSIVVTSEGVFFQSDQGIELLTRQLDVQFVGKKIQTTINQADYPTCTAAVLDSRNGLVRFSFAAAGSSTDGLDAVYDLVLGIWPSFDGKTSHAAHAYAQTVSAAFCSTASGYVYTWLGPDGYVYTENLPSAGKKDDGNWIQSWWETPWLKSELQREHQMWQAILLYASEDAAGLTAEVAYDWLDYDAGNNKVWTDTETTTYSPQVELRVTGRRQSVKFRFSDTAPVVSDQGLGLEWIGLSLDYAPHQGETQGTPRLPVGARK